MTKVIAILCLLTAAGLLAFMSPQVQFYTKPRHQRLYNLWKADIDRLQQNPEFKKLLLNVGDVELGFTDPQVSEELDLLNPPIKKTEGASLSMKVEVIRWIDKNNYGYVLQHEIFDNTENKIYEFGRTYKVGIIW